MIQMNEEIITIVVDGGSKGNHQKDEPREGYGSAKIFYQGMEKRHLDWEFGDVTNNTAEWKALEKVLQYLTDRENATKKKGLEFPKVSILLDSRQIEQTMLGRMNIKKRHLKEISDECQLWYLGREDRVQFCRISGDAVKVVLGH